MDVIDVLAVAEMIIGGLEGYRGRALGSRNEQRWIDRYI